MNGKNREKSQDLLVYRKKLSAFPLLRGLCSQYLAQKRRGQYVETCNVLTR